MFWLTQATVIIAEIISFAINVGGVPKRSLTVYSKIFQKSSLYYYLAVNNFFSEFGR